MPTISFLNLTKLHKPHREEFLEVFRNISDESRFICGPELEKFEKDFAHWVGNGFHCVGTANGTDAITLAALALNLPKNSEAIIPAMTFFATAEGLMNAGIRIKLVDITSDTWLIDTDKIASAITPQTKLIVPVHLYGQMAPMDKIREIAEKHNFALLEDSAQAHGALWKEKPVGTWGDIATYSFFPGKNLGAFGDAGAVLSRNPSLIERASKFGKHGGLIKYEHDLVGYNSRLDNLQAGILSVKLKYLKQWNDRRRAIAAQYRSELSGIDGLRLPTEHKDSHHVYHLYVVQVEKRDDFMKFVGERGVQTGKHYPLAIHQLPALKTESFAKQSFPNAERLAAHGVSIPMCPTLTDEEVSHVTDSIRAYFKSR